MHLLDPIRLDVTLGVAFKLETPEVIQNHLTFSERFELKCVGAQKPKYFYQISLGTRSKYCQLSFAL